MTNPSPSDRELIAAASQGKVAAFATLIGRYRDVRTRFAMRMLGDYDAADEALQAAFVRAFQSLSRYREAESFEGWLFRIVINECRARALRQAVRSRRNTGEVDAIADWRAAVEGPENGADVQRALDQIDPINREAFILQYIEELPYAEISTLTGASVVTIERQVDRACSRLRELLPNWKPQTPQRGSIPGLDASLSDVGPSFPVRASMPLRRAEVLNESFEDRLMPKLLRAVEAPADEAGIRATDPKPFASIPADSRSSLAPRPRTLADTQPPMAASSLSAEPKEKPMPMTPPPSPILMPEPSLFPKGLKLPRLPQLSRLAQVGIAVAAAALAFGAGYAFRGPGKARRAPVAAPAKVKAAAPRIVRRTDTVRVVRSDTLVLARFVFADAAAKSVAVVGDFNRWDAGATLLTRVGGGSWARTLRLTPGRHEYAFIVDGKRWVTDRFAPASHDAFDVQSSVLAGTSSADAEGQGTTSSRIKKLLPQASAQRVLASIVSARERGLPAAALESRALKFAAKGVKASDIEDAIVADAEAMGKAQQLLVSAGRKEPSADEIDDAAQLLGEGADSASIAALAKFAAAGRSIGVPLRVSAELAATTSSPKETLARVEDRVRSGATDAELEQMLTEPASSKRVAASSREKGKDPHLAKAKSGTSVKQAGTPATTQSSTTKKKKAADK